MVTGKACGVWMNTLEDVQKCHHAFHLPHMTGEGTVIELQHSDSVADLHTLLTRWTHVLLVPLVNRCPLTFMYLFEMCNNERLYTHVTWFRFWIVQNMLTQLVIQCLFYWKT